MLAEIAVAKVGIELFLGRNQLFDVGEILVAERTQMIGDRFWSDNFWAHEPERIGEWKPHDFLPIFAEIEKLKFVGVFTPKPNRLVADEQASRLFRSGRCRSWDEARMQF